MIEFLFISVHSNQRDWEFHFHEVTLIGCCVYTYTWLVPCILWALLWWRGNRLRFTLLQLLAIYGYSIGIFIPLMVCFYTVTSSFVEQIWQCIVIWGQFYFVLLSNQVFWLIRNGVIRWVLWGLSTFSSGIPGQYSTQQ